MNTFKLSYFCLSAAFTLGLVGSASATTVTIGGTADGDLGMMTSVAGATTVTFNGSSALPSGFSASHTHPSNPVVQGSVLNLYKAPTDDSSNYLTTGTGSIVDTLNTPSTYFGFYWGSLDSYNDLKITESNGAVFNMTGSELASDYHVTANGNCSYFFNFFADPGTTIESVEFSSSTNSFEIDNVATASATPEPATIAMLTGGLLICAGSIRRRKA